MSGQERVSEIREKFAAAGTDELPGLLKRYADDDRAGVRSAADSAKKKLSAYEKELNRISVMLTQERRYASYGAVCGVDEVGRGPLAGPVVACAVILDAGRPVLYVNDSKKLSAKMREKLYDEITAGAVSIGTGMASNEVIDRINILQADYEAMREAVSKLDPHPDVMLNDAVTVPGIGGTLQVPIIKGDSKSLSIAAASIIAKVTRDRIMTDYDRIYPEYGFAKNKGYATADHIAAVKKYGPCPLHRMSFLKNFL